MHLFIFLHYPKSIRAPILTKKPSYFPSADELNTHDPLDPTSLPPTTRRRLNTLLSTHQSPRSSKTRLRIGIPSSYNTTSLSPSVRHAWRRSLLHLRDNLGHTLHPVELPTTQQALSAYYVLAPAEASSNLAKYDGVRYGASFPTSSSPPGEEEATSAKQQQQLFASTRHQSFHPEIRRRILLGTYTLSAAAIDNYFLQAQRLRRLIQHDFNTTFNLPNILSPTPSTPEEQETREETPPKIDILLTPTTPSLPPLLSDLPNLPPVATYATDVFTVPASLAGLPAISVPVGIPGEMAAAEGAEGVESAGVQVLGQFGDDSRVLEVAEMLAEGVCIAAR